MPFTPAHAAAALPFRRTRLIPSALVVGTFAPDFEYFLRLSAGGGWGHHLAGAFCMSLPLGLAFLWVFHRFVKAPAAALLPDGFEHRLIPYLRPFQFGGVRRFGLIVASMLVGIATHILWDDLTHGRSFVFRHWRALGHVVKLPVVGWTPYYGVLQYISSIGGLAILAFWVAHWYRATAPAQWRGGQRFSAVQKAVILSSMTMIAAAGAVLRALAGVGAPEDSTQLKIFIGETIVTFGALFWWQLVVWGAMLRWRAARVAASSAKQYRKTGT